MNRLGIAFVGASARSGSMLHYLREHPYQARVIGYYDTIPGRAELLNGELGQEGAIIYSSLEELLADDKVHAVFVGTPDNEHVLPAVKAMQAGKHVFCEKPMAITLEECDTIIDAAQKCSTIFYMGMNLRHSPMFETLHNLVISGQLGKILTIESNEYYSGGRSYFRRWNRLEKCSGGLWITKSCHDFDLLNWISGGKPTRVYATNNLSYYGPKPGAAEYCRICQLKDSCPDYYNIAEFESTLGDRMRKLSEEVSGQPRDLCLFNSDKDTFDNGIAVIDYDNDVRATYTVNVVSARDTRQMRIMGTKGSAEGDVAQAKVTFWPRYSKDCVVYDLRERMKTGHGGADVRIFGDFFECCRTGKSPRSAWVDGRLSVQVGLAARESGCTGKPVLLASASDRAEKTSNCFCEA